jgi:hypothetical protein
VAQNDIWVYTIITSVDAGATIYDVSFAVQHLDVCHTFFDIAATMKVLSMLLVLSDIVKFNELCQVGFESI